MEELAGKARALEMRSRTELARDAWESVLHQDANNAEALRSAIRLARSTGHPATAETYLKRLETAHPDDPALRELKDNVWAGNRDSKLQQADRLSRQGRYAEASVLYKEVFGANPPQGETAVRYYVAEGQTEQGRPHAIAGLRALADRFPADRRYQRALGALLLLNGRTAQEGAKLLGSGTHNASTITEASLASTASFASPPPQTPPVDRGTQVAAVERSLEPPALPPQPVAVENHSVPLLLAQPKGQADPPGAASGNTVQINRSPVAEHPPQRAASTTEAPAGTVSPLSVASVTPTPVPGSASAVTRSPFSPRNDRLDEQTAYAALNGGRLHEASLRFKVLLARDPENARAQGGLGLVLVRQGQAEEALPLLQAAQQNGAGTPAIARAFEQAQRSEARTTKQTADVLVAQGSASDEVHKLRLPRTSEPLSSPAAQRTPEAPAASLEQAALSSPAARDGGQGPKPQAVKGAHETLPQDKTVLEQDDVEQALAAYRESLRTAPADTGARTALLSTLHGRGQDSMALQAIEGTPQDQLQADLRAPEFAVIVAEVERAQSRNGAARQVLEDLLAKAPQPLSRAYGPAHLQLASLLLAQGQAAQAYAAYRSALANTEFNNAQAWTGLLAALHSSGHDREALAQMNSIPASVRLQMESDVHFLETATLIFVGVNDGTQAPSLFHRLEQTSAQQHVVVSAELTIQFAQWLAQRSDEPHLYPVLLALGSRLDLTIAQRRSVQQIWVDWAVRQSVDQARRGEIERARLTLNIAAAAFPGNPEAPRSLARGYAAAGLPKTALALLRVQDLSGASAEDLSFAVRTALDARAPKDAEGWLRLGLLRFRKDPELLMLASRFEQQAGRKQEAAVYLQAALSVAPARAANDASPLGTARSASALGSSADAVAARAPDVAGILAKSRSLSKNGGASPPGAVQPFLPSFADVAPQPAR